MNIQDFVQDFKNKGIKNTQLKPNAIGEYLQEHLEIKTYIPFDMKRRLAEMVVDVNTEEVDGVWKHDSINAYLSFIVAMVQSHTNLEFSGDPVADYDILAENELLAPIIELFRTDYNECDVVLKMALAAKLDENNISAIIGRFLNGVLVKLDGVGEVLKSAVGDFNIQDIMGKFNEEDLTKLVGLLNK